jgi:hypothetical protein
VLKEFFQGLRVQCRGCLERPASEESAVGEEDIVMGVEVQLHFTRTKPLWRMPQSQSGLINGLYPNFVLGWAHQFHLEGVCYGCLH